MMEKGKLITAELKMQCRNLSSFICRGEIPSSAKIVGISLFFVCLGLPFSHQLLHERFGHSVIELRHLHLLGMILGKRG